MTLVIAIWDAARLRLPGFGSVGSGGLVPGSGGAPQFVISGKL
jgi:hypothetical protein